MRSQNERPSPQTMANRIKNHNRVNYRIRRQLLQLANAIKNDAFDLVDSNLLKLKLVTEIQIMRAKIGDRS